MKPSIVKPISLILLLCVLSGLFVGCTNTAAVDTTGFYFNTIVQITLYGNDAKIGNDCLLICDKYEKLLSRTLEGSDIYNINHSNGAPVEVSSETAYLLETALTYCELTDGQIDLTVAPLMDLWDFTSESTTMPPSDDEIKEALSHVNYKNLTVNKTTVTLSDPKAGVDLGFLAKGYVADQIKSYLISKNVKSAIINLGGNVLTIGVKPDCSPYHIGIQTPFASMGTAITSVEVTDSSVVTSGIYERYFQYNGTIYHHILNPKTGYPVQNELNSVSILSSSSMEGDALSTTCLLLGMEESEKILSEASAVQAIYVTRDNELK